MRFFSNVREAASEAGEAQRDFGVTEPDTLNLAESYFVLIAYFKYCEVNPIITDKNIALPRMVFASFVKT